MRTVLHLVRASAPPEAVVAARDWVVYLAPRAGDAPRPPRLAAHGSPPIHPGPIDHDQLVALSFAADVVITW